MARQRYRSKLEVFRDVLVATRHASRKTRIMGLANLNPLSFRRHMDFALSHGLIVVDEGNYHLTDRADRVLAALQELMAKSNELDRAIQSLERSALPKRSNRWAEGAVLRNVSRIAWIDVSRGDWPGAGLFSKSGAMSPAPGPSRNTSHAITDLVSSLQLPPSPSLPSSRPVRRTAPPPPRSPRETSAQELSST